ncbi:hypothetical protein Ciccas_007504 [Cichlidogyrus casuarinus]|uniref:Uncharacterized protein n=1 Tax=Cichlidogyrus casuarinus TaxID=1844966 RepID=A0ABD2Q311_9PLAT
MKDLKIVMKNSRSVEVSKGSETGRSEETTTAAESSSNNATSSENATDSTVQPLTSQEEQGLAMGLKMTKTDAACVWIFKLDYQAWPYCLAETLPISDVFARLNGSALFPS